MKGQEKRLTMKTRWAQGLMEVKVLRPSGRVNARQLKWLGEPEIVP